MFDFDKAVQAVDAKLKEQQEETKRNDEEVKRIANELATQADKWRNAKGFNFDVTRNGSKVVLTSGRRSLHIEVIPGPNFTFKETINGASNSSGVNGGPTGSVGMRESIYLWVKSL
ncbi:hypothetical protein [Methylobacterium sp. ARG-1]|uniref:hypothetical protein n=1 Tax=Methylobacterium sp. ARG-1 TaxID=1692501 RepID=UPI0011873EFF|nr:hypothetical protein [Methylobacterium sp. ARG-1]